MKASSVMLATSVKADAPSHVRRLIPALVALAVAQIALLGFTISKRLEGVPVVETESALASAIWLLGQLGALAAVAILLWRFVLVARYRPCPSVPDAQLPEITVVVPAYNEGQQVYKTIQSLVESDYPEDKLRIVAIDDGSLDDTWSWIELGALHYSDRVIAVRCAKNGGKRAALYEGFKRATGTVLVTVDSDSEVLRDTLRNMVSPFVVDPQVGGVAGNVRVLNEDGGAFSSMLDVSFTFAFEFMRASESMVDTVMCCPGALSAYRRDLIEACKDEWLVQTFMGRPANIGEDRALTNLVLAMGYFVRFQSNAIVLTEVPTKLPQLCRMLLRWARSNVRETIVMAGFAFSRFREGPKLGARINLVWSASRILIGAALFIPTILALVVHPSLVLWLIVGALVSAVVPAAIFAASRPHLRAWWAFPYAILSATCLSWIAPYALVTAQKSKWLTRELPAASPRALGSSSTDDAAMAAE